jgi:hypothetical protein
MTPVSQKQLEYLANLVTAGGSGEWDHRRGVVLVGPTRGPLPGSVNDWMALMVNELVGGERGRVIVTSKGEIEAAKVASGRVREGAN